MLAYAINNHSIKFVGDTKKEIQEKVYEYLVDRELKLALSDTKSIEVSMGLRVNSNGRHEIAVITTDKNGSITKSKRGLTLRYEDNSSVNTFRTIYIAK